MFNKCYIIPVSSACNCNCTFCITKERDIVNEILKPEVFQKSLEILKKENIKRFEITGGGEPFLNKYLQIIIDMIKREIPDSYVKVYTNGNILTKLNNIDELNISIAHYNDKINQSIMKPVTYIPLIDKLKFFKSDDYKLRLSVALIQGGIDRNYKLKELISLTENYIDEYVVRTVYQGLDSGQYVNFDYYDRRLIWERNNSTGCNNNLILEANGLFYKDWEIKEERYMKGYILLKPDSAPYIDEIIKYINNKGFLITEKYLIENFKAFAKKLYYWKDKDYLKLIHNHIDTTSLLFGNRGLILILDKNIPFDDLIKEIDNLKTELRKEFSFYGKKGSINTPNGSMCYLNMIHCPDPISEFYNIDYSNIKNEKLISLHILEKIKKYKSFYYEE